MPHIAFLFLANHAEVREGLLNVLGGGWNRHAFTQQADGAPALAHISIVVGVAFEPGDTGQTRLSLGIESDTGETILGVEGGAEVGGEGAQITRLVIAALNTEIRWPRPGLYRLRGSIDPNQETRFIFTVEERQSTATESTSRSRPAAPSVPA